MSLNPFDITPKAQVRRAAELLVAVRGPNRHPVADAEVQRPGPEALLEAKPGPHWGPRARRDGEKDGSNIQVLAMMSELEVCSFELGNSTDFHTMVHDQRAAGWLRL